MSDGSLLRLVCLIIALRRVYCTVTEEVLKWRLLGIGLCLSQNDASLALPQCINFFMYRLERVLCLTFQGWINLPDVDTFVLALVSTPVTSGQDWIPCSHVCAIHLHHYQHACRP
jgi:hypothetical protein